MPAGLQTFRANGDLHTDLTDRLTKLVLKGTIVGLGENKGRFIAHGDITTANKAEWFVACTMGNSFQLNNGGFTVYATGQSGGTFHYSLFRW